MVDSIKTQIRDLILALQEPSCDIVQVYIKMLEILQKLRTIAEFALQ